ncbi:ABC transporter permease [Sphingobacterium sp. T2]|nr:ABC transporter permease [Sphingobacterium sp. T2]
MLALAYKFIRYDRAKSIGIITAIVISIFLIGQQLSLMFFLMGLMGNLVGNAYVSDNQLWIIESQSSNINAVNVIDRRLVQQIASLPEVESTYPVVVAPAQASFLDGKTAPVTLIGTNSPSFIMGPLESKIHEGRLIDLIQPASVSAELYNAKTWKTTLELNKPIEINGKSAKIALITKNAQTFGASIMYTSIENAQMLGNVSPSKVSIIIATVKNVEDKAKVRRDIEQLFPNLRAWDANKLKNSSVMEIMITSNMGMSFGTLVLFA